MTRAMTEQERIDVRQMRAHGVSVAKIAAQTNWSERTVRYVIDPKTKSEKERDTNRARDRRTKLIAPINRKGLWREQNIPKEVRDKAKSGTCAECGQRLNPMDFETDTMGQTNDPTHCWRCRQRLRERRKPGTLMHTFMREVADV